MEKKTRRSLDLFWVKFSLDIANRKMQSAIMVEFKTSRELTYSMVTILGRGIRCYA